jgi:hypothetical protein
MDNKNDGLKIDYVPSGRNGTATLTVRLADQVLAVESLNLAKPKARAEFIASLCKDRPGIDPKLVDAELLRLAADLAGRADATPLDASHLGEIDVSSIVRPERFIRPEVSGLTVPTMADLAGKPVGRWLTYLRWADGRRQCRPLPDALELADRVKVWIHPQPSDPAANTLPGCWSAVSRRAWLDSNAAPDPASVFHRVCELMAHFIDVPGEHAPGTVSTLALWVQLTYVYQVWDAVPYLYVGGALGSGKTRVFEILARLVFRPLSSSNMTGAALFRTLHNQGGTLLLDEAERLRQTQDAEVVALVSMLLAGYKRGGTATRLEAVGDTFKTVAFDVYGPKALACIAGLPPALASRCIPIYMFRAPPGSEKPKRRIDTAPAGWQRLRDDLCVLALEHGPTWLSLPGMVDVCPKMSGRDFELWQPLLSLAWWLESHGARGLLALMQAHAMTVIEAGKDDATPDQDESLLKLLADAVRSGDRPTPAEILDKARHAEPEGFKRWTPRGVAEHLKRYGLATNKSCGRKVYGQVTVSKLLAVQENYGVDLGMDPQSDGT